MIPAVNPYALAVAATVCFAVQGILYEKIQKQGQMAACILMLGDIAVVLAAMVWYLWQPQKLSSLSSDQWKLLALVGLILAGGMVLMLSSYAKGAQAQKVALILMLIPVWTPVIQRVLGIGVHLDWAQVTAFVLGLTAVVLVIVVSPRIQQRQEGARTMTVPDDAP